MPVKPFLVGAVCLFGLAGSLFAQDRVVRLYEGAAPGSEQWYWQEGESAVNGFNTHLVYNVVNPEVWVFLPDPQLATGAAMIVAPGGAFHILSIDNEGTDVARWLNERGIAAFVLKYRLARSMTDDPVRELSARMADFDELDRVNAPIVRLATQDGLTAMRHVRDRAGAYGIDPAKVGFMGFSAGATLTLSVVQSADDASRPDLVAPIYPYERAIIGEGIPAARTPIFIAAASDDQLGLAPHSVSIYSAWLAAGQPATLHMYERGGHGFGMRRQDAPSDRWTAAFGDWLVTQGWATTTPH
ncbi:MAG: alpha/beta hydrolase [Rhodothermales bacterium]